MSARNTNTPRIEIYPHDTTRYGLILEAATPESLLPLFPLPPATKAHMTVGDQETLRTAYDTWKNLTRSPAFNLWTMHMVSPDDGKQSLAGLTTASPIPYQADSLNLGRFLCKPEAHRKGLGSLAALAISQYVFGTCITTLQATTLDINSAAQTSLARTGFVNISDRDPLMDFYGAGEETAANTHWALFDPGRERTGLHNRHTVTPELVAQSHATYRAALDTVNIILPQ